MTRALLTSAQVAQLLGRSVTWFSRNRARLEDAHGFPPSVWGLGARWDSAAIERWLDQQMPKAPAEPDHAAILIARAQAGLRH